MQHMRNGIWILPVILLLAGCGGGDSANSDSASSPKDDSVFDPMVGTIDKAKAVEGLSADRKDELDEQIDKSR